MKKWKKDRRKKERRIEIEKERKDKKLTNKPKEIRKKAETNKQREKRKKERRNKQTKREKKKERDEREKERRPLLSVERSCVCGHLIHPNTTVMFVGLSWSILLSIVNSTVWVWPLSVIFIIFDGGTC